MPPGSRGDKGLLDQAMEDALTTAGGRGAAAPHAGS